MRNEREPPHNNGRTSDGRLAVELSSQKRSAARADPQNARGQIHPSVCQSTEGSVLTRPSRCGIRAQPSSAQRPIVRSAPGVTRRAV